MVRETRLFLAGQEMRSKAGILVRKTQMARIVMKFGGTSVANIERIRNVAQHVKREVDAVRKKHPPCMMPANMMRLLPPASR